MTVIVLNNRYSKHLFGIKAFELVTIDLPLSSTYPEHYTKNRTHDNRTFTSSYKQRGQDDHGRPVYVEVGVVPE